MLYHAAHKLSFLRLYIQPPVAFRFAESSILPNRLIHPRLRRINHRTQDANQITQPFDSGFLKRITFEENENQGMIMHSLIIQSEPLRLDVRTVEDAHTDAEHRRDQLSLSRSHRDRDKDGGSNRQEPRSHRARDIRG